MITSRRLLRLASILAVGAVVGVLSLPWGSATSGWVGPGRVTVHASVGLVGRTSVLLPPLGSLTAATPAAPVHLEARVDELDVSKVAALLDDDDPQGTLDRAADEDLGVLLRRMALRAVLVAAVAGALAAALLPRRRWWFLPIGAGAAVVAIAAVGALAWSRFDSEALVQQPTFEGALERAPSLIESAQRHGTDIAEVQDRVRAVSGQLAALYEASGGVDIGAGGGSGTRILHVSDVHLNPLALEFVARMAEDFDADAVIDTGDLTSFGLPLEARVAALVATVPTRYLFVPGNHDSRENRAAIDALPNVELLDGTTTTVGSVQIMGIGDPTFTASNETTTGEANDQKRRLTRVVARQVRAAAPDVLAVHDPAQAADVGGIVPLVLAGHRHERQEARDEGTLVLTVGSTGAGGLGSFTVDTSEPYEAELLHFRGGELVAIDYLTLHGVSGNLTIERQVVEPAEDEEVGEPDA